MKYIELSHNITSEIPVHPYDSPLCLFQEKFLKQDKFNGYRLETSLHVGTHIDCPSHLTDRTVYIRDYPMDRFIGKGILFDVRGKSTVSASDLNTQPIPEDSIVLLVTGYDAFFAEERYFSLHPAIDESAIDFLLSKNIKMLGIDASSPDVYPFPVHQRLFQHDVLLIENLTNLSALLGCQHVTIYAIPLPLAAEASLARVFAQVEEPAKIP